MSAISTVIAAAERLPLPDPVTRAGIGYLVGRTARHLRRRGEQSNPAFARDMTRYAVAENTGDANAQHYELPPDFFALFLGARRKYSCCLYPTADTTLDQAEEFALAETAHHAGLGDGQSILELGCGWGSLSLWMAEQYPHARITAVSNSHSQRAYIEQQAMLRQIRNLTVITADMNAFQAAGRFDRVVSVEMFEHMANWRALLARVRSWLTLDGRLFMHIFTHRQAPYRYDITDKADWIAQHFFTGGIMPSHGLVRQFDDLFTLEQDWFWNGQHYRRTAEDWLANYDAREDEIMPVLTQVYGRDARLWQRRWRLFFLATAGMFGHAGGTEWGVSHYRLKPVH
jgi:cyclopropane-fatty-acyl-phospholipid synthase